MIFILPLVAALGAAVGAVVGAFTTHAVGEKDRQAAKHHRQVANELTGKYANLEKNYSEFANESKRQINDLTRQNVLNEVEKDCLRLAVRLQQNLISLMWEIDRRPTADALNTFQAAVEQTNQVLSQLEEELIIVPNDYSARLLTAIKTSKPVKAIKPVSSVKPDDVARKTILSVDLGRTSTKTTVSHEPNSVVFIPSNIKQITCEGLRNGIFKVRATDPLMNLWMEHQGSGYAIGQLAGQLGANLGIGQSKLVDALAKVLSCAGYFKLKDDISVVISLPYHSQEQFECEKSQLISQVSGPHVMNFRGEAVALDVNKVWVMPEGYGSLLWCEAQPKKGSNSPNFTKLCVAVVDIGHQNIDMLMVDNFQFVKHASKSSEGSGMNKFYELIAAEIEGSDAQSLSLIAAVNRPKSDRFYRPRSVSKPTNLDDFLPNLIEMFSREICNRILAWLPERVTDVILTGGGGEFFWDDMQRLLKEAKISAHLAAPSRQANALGQYIYGEAQLSNRLK